MQRVKNFKLDTALRDACEDDLMDQCNVPPQQHALLHSPALPLPMQRVKNFKLDTALRDACEDDLMDQCSVSLKDMDDSDSVKRMGLNCLQQYKEELKSDTCRAEVHRRMKVGAWCGVAVTVSRGWDSTACRSTRRS